MKAITAFELLLLVERARVSSDTNYRNYVLDEVKNILGACIRDLLTPPDEKPKAPK